MRRLALTGIALMLSLIVLTGCVRMPTSGPVVQSQGGTSDDVATETDYDPKPPQSGESANEIVVDFLEAMKATPINTSVAQEYLTQAAQKTWDPGLSTITYDDIGEPTGELNLSVPITGVNEYDARGSWVRQVGNGAADGVPDDSLDFRLTIEDEEWRISDLPDALVVPTSWFNDRFRRVSLYFFDPTAQILVPEPVFAPVGDQFATSLLNGLLAGPGPGRSRVTSTFIPEAMRPGLSVPIKDGVAEVTLPGELGDASELVTEQMLAQLVWTLRQEPRIEALRLYQGAEPLTLPGGESTVSIDSAGRYDPNGAQTSNQLFALRDGLLVTGGVDELQPTGGRFGTERLGLRDVSVDLTGAIATGISGQGTSVLTAPVDASDATATEIDSDAIDLLRPAWDVGNRLWLVDRANGSARVSILVDGVPRELTVPGVTGKRVQDFLVSRDGTRFVALVRGRVDKVVVARVLHDAQGRVLRAGESRRLDLGEDQSRRIRDIAWRSLTSLAILNPVTGDLSQVRTVSVDGAPGDAEPPGWSRMRGGAQRLVSSSVDGDGVYVLSDEEYSDLTDTNRTIDLLDPGVTAMGYAG